MGGQETQKMQRERHMETTAERLIGEASVVCKHHMEIAALTGELFNIFSILRMESNEIGTHSRLLAELLNPDGSHNLGDTFLKLFVEQLQIEPFDTKSAEAKAEVYIGRKTVDSGGRIDILITDAAKRKIVIENKIYADDQDNQLLRYWNNDTNAHLFYLTLNGDMPSDFSTGRVTNAVPKIFYKCISYRYDILKWLDKCRKEATNLPILRETLTQYVILIKTLTDQNLTTKMNNELLDTVLKSADNLDGFFALVSIHDAVYGRILTQLEVNMRALAERHQLTLTFNVDRQSRWNGFFFDNEQLTKRNIRIGFEFQEKWTKNLEFGFQFLDLSRKELAPTGLKDLFKEKFSEAQDSDWWPCYTFWQEWRSWNQQQYKDIHFGSFIPSLNHKLLELLEVFNGALSEPTCA